MSIPLHLLRLSNRKLWYSSSLGHGTSHVSCVCVLKISFHIKVFSWRSLKHILTKNSTCLASANFERQILYLFSQIFQCSVSRQFSPQARWRPFPHHLWRRIGSSFWGVHFIRWKSASSGCLGTTKKPYQNQGHWVCYQSLKPGSKYLVNIQNYSHSWRTPHKVFAWLISNKSRAHFFLIVSAQRHGVEQVNRSIWKRDEMVEQLSDLTKTEVDPIDLSVPHRLRKTEPTHHHHRNCHPVINPPDLRPGWVGVDKSHWVNTWSVHQNGIRINDQSHQHESNPPFQTNLTEKWELLTQLANATQSVCLIDQQQEQSTLLFDCVCSKAWGRAGESIHLEKRWDGWTTEWPHQNRGGPNWSLSPTQTEKNRTNTSSS